MMTQWGHTIDQAIVEWTNEADDEMMIVVCVVVVVLSGFFCLSSGILSPDV